MDLAAFLVDGLLIGCVYGLAAMGMTLIWGVMKVINLAHGTLIALGCFGVYLFFQNAHLNPYLGLVMVAILGLLLGVVIYFLAIHRVIRASYLSTLLATFAVNMILLGIGTIVFTTSPRTINFSLGTVQVGGVTIMVTRLVAAVVSVAVTALLYIFLYRTTPGKQIRAVANNPGAAEIVGINSARILGLSFGLGVMLAMISGGLISTFFPFTILSGSVYQLKSFVIGVLGGLGNPIGSLVGGLILGALEGISPAFMPVSWTPVFEFVLFVIILMVRPQGLLGSKK
jgi:branched-subunit amino acid ABC-type transport system permease component